MKNKLIKLFGKKNKLFLIFYSGLILGVTISLTGTAVLLERVVKKEMPEETAQEAVKACNLTETDVDSIDGETKVLAEAAAYVRFKEIKASFVPTGMPKIYGKELNISFDQVQDAINKVAPFDPTYGQQKIILAGKELERYIDIGSRIACEFCCGAKTLVFENGEAACGCDHSQMMRGLAAYLIQNHREMTNEQILEDLALWKRTYFPKQTLTQELDKRLKAGESGIQDILDEFPDFLPQMVGGC